MPANEVRVGDIGTEFLITLKDGTSAVDISGADASEKRVIKFKKPSGATYEVNPTLKTDGTDGKLTYTTVDGNIDEEGMWQMQAKVTFGTQTFRSDIHKFKVHRNL